MQNLSSEEIKKLDLQQLAEYLENKVPEIYRTSNNFHLHFIDNYYRPGNDTDPRWEQRYNVFQNTKYSERNKGETRREFYTNVDTVVLEITGKNYQDYHTLLMEASAQSVNHDDKNFQRYAVKYDQLVAPVLAKLYSLGYNWADLCG